MKNLSKLAVFLLAVGLVLGLAGCSDDTDNGTPIGGGGSDVNFENQLSGFLVRVQNNTDKRLVVFKGSLPSSGTLIGGIPANAQNHGLPKSTSLFNQTEGFVMFIVTEEDYIANKSNLNSLKNKPFVQIYAFHNKNAENNLVYSISDLLGGTKRITINNNTGFNVELRLNGINPEVGGQILGYAASGSFNTVLNVDEGDYMVFPVFRKFNDSRQEIFTFYPKYTSGNGAGKAKFTAFSLKGSKEEEIIDAHDYMTNDVVLKTGSAYLMIQNNHSTTGLEFYKGGSPILTSTGGRYINRTETMTFQIDMPKKPGSSSSYNDEYMDSLEMVGFSIGTGAYKAPLDAFTFESDVIYQVIITGNDPYTVNLSSITKISTVTWDSL